MGEKGELSFVMHTDPKKALQEIKKRSAPFALNHSAFTNITDAYADDHLPEQAHIVVDVNASSVYRTIYSEDRFKNIAVVVVDCAMPVMNGLEFARQARKVGNKLLKIIMLTGEADEALAVKAFNEGVIDKFIKKTSPSYMQDLNEAIAPLQKDYFCEASQGLITTLSTNKDFCLSDGAFIKLFNDLCQEKNICEYYLADEMGSFLLADKDGNTFWLIVNSGNMLNNYAGVADSSEYPSEISEGLRAQQKFYFYCCIRICFCRLVNGVNTCMPRKR